MVLTANPRPGLTAITLDFAKFFEQLFGDYVVTGLTPSAGAGLTLNIAAGDARIKGEWVNESVAITQTMTDNATNHVYLQLTQDPQNRWNGAQYVVNTTGVDPANSIKLAQVVTSAGAITTVTDKRTLVVVIASSKGLRASGGIRTKTKAGVPVDGDFDNPEDGILVVDTTNADLYYRSGTFKKTVSSIAVDKVTAPAAVAADYATPSVAAGSSENAAGNEAIGGTTLNTSGLNGYAQGQKITLGASNRIVTHIALNITSGFAGNIRVAIYDHDAVNDKPNNLLVESADVALTANGWAIIPITPIKLTASTVYWLGFQVTSSTMSVYYIDTGVAGSRKARLWTYGAFPNPFGTADASQPTVFNQRIEWDLLAANTKDDNLDKHWAPSPFKEANAWCRWDLTGAKLGGISGCRISWPNRTALRPTNYKLQRSEDAVTWTDIQTLTVDPGAGWKEYSWTPLPSTVRYIRIQITTHGSDGTVITEFDYYQADIWRHGHSA